MAKPKHTLDNACMYLLRVAEFAEKVGVHKGTVQRWLSKDLIPFVRLPSGERRISSEVADALLRSSCKPQPPNEGEVDGL